MESRAATRLGENIKLLTFVSVFFLPLSFCTVSPYGLQKRSELLTFSKSIWSIQNGPSNPATLTYVCIIVGLVTYVIVFNLHLIVRTFSRSYSTYKAYLVRKMRQEQEEIWRQRGRCYDVFRPVHEQEKPTEWLILWYILWRACSGFWTSTRRAHNEGSLEPEEEKAF